MRILLFPFFALICRFVSDTRFEVPFSHFIEDYYRDFDLF